MRYVYFGASGSDLSNRVLNWLRSEAGEPLAILGGPVHGPEDRARVAATQAQLGISVGYRSIIPLDVIGLFPLGIVNLHTSYLPWNRGAYPNVWPILDGSPAGVTLHYMDAGLDTGPIIAQHRVEVEPWDTAKTLYDRLADAAFGLFGDAWPLRKRWRDLARNQVGNGSVHLRRDLPTLPLDFQSAMFLRWLRARSFPPRYGLEIDGVRWTISGEPIADR